MVVQGEAWSKQLAALRRICLDSNVVIYMLERTEPYTAPLRSVLQAMEAASLVSVVPTIVELESLVKPFRDRDNVAIDTTLRFFRETSGLVVKDMDSAIAQRAAALRAQRRLSLADAIIAATAIEERCDAVIGNDADMAARVIGIPYLYLDNYIR